jgi:hypothetical protein
MDNVQEHNMCTSLPSSQTFRSYLEELIEISLLYFLASDVTSGLWIREAENLVQLR